VGLQRRVHRLIVVPDQMAASATHPVNTKREFDQVAELVGWNTVLTREHLNDHMMANGADIREHERGECSRIGG
jgi:hypothetical protein